MSKQDCFWAAQSHTFDNFDSARSSIEFVRKKVVAAKPEMPIKRVGVMSAAAAFFGERTPKIKVIDPNARLMKRLEKADKLIDMAELITQRALEDVP